MGSAHPGDADSEAGEPRVEAGLGHCLPNKSPVLLICDLTLNLCSGAGFPGFTMPTPCPSLQQARAACIPKKPQEILVMLCGYKARAPRETNQTVQMLYRPEPEMCRY